MPPTNTIQIDCPCDGDSVPVGFSTRGVYDQTYGPPAVKVVLRLYRENVPNPIAEKEAGVPGDMTWRYTFSSGDTPVEDNITLEAELQAANGTALASTCIVVHIRRIPTIVSLTSSDNPSTFGTQVTFEAQVDTDTTGFRFCNDDMTQPDLDGNVDFKDNAAVCHSETVMGTPPVMVTWDVSDLSVGNHTIEAVFAQTTHHSAGSRQIPQVVNKADTTTEVTSDSNPSMVDMEVTFTATVTSPSGATTGPGGDVEFYVDDELQSTEVLNGGTATWKKTFAAAGMYQVVAKYLGDANYSASESAAYTQEVTEE